jgi:hypothetical protein
MSANPECEESDLDVIVQRNLLLCDRNGLKTSKGYMVALNGIVVGCACGLWKASSACGAK